MALRITLATGQQHIVDFNHESTLAVTNMGQAEPGSPLSERTQAWTDIVAVEMIAESEPDTGPDDSPAVQAAIDAAGGNPATITFQPMPPGSSVHGVTFTGGLSNMLPQSEPPAQPEADIQPPPDAPSAVESLLEKTRDELNAIAEQIGISEPHKLPNKQAVADAIIPLVLAPDAAGDPAADAADADDSPAA